MAKKKDSIARDFGGLAFAGAGLGIAGGIAGAAGAPAGVSQAIGSTAGFLPIVGGAIVLKHVGKTLRPKKTRRMY